MLLVDTLVVVGMATVSLGTIHEADGHQQRSFWLRNDGAAVLQLERGYTSCGCTTITFDKGRQLSPGDSAQVTLLFNPRGKGGEFEEAGTVEWTALSPSGKKGRVRMAMTGQCITSEETLMQQFPVRISDALRLSTNRIDLGVMRPGESKERGIVILHRDEGNRKERIPIVFRVDQNTGKGLQHIDHPFTIRAQGRQQVVHITLDVFVK